MASILDTRFRVTDAAGVPISGGKVRVYNANTVTLATLYTTADLNPATPLANPVVADAAGWAPQIFAAAGNYDLAVMTAASVILKTQEDVPALGPDGTTFLQDFTNSRAAIRGVGGVVYFEAGDPSPDNTGGSGRNGGWLGTQADAWTIDALVTTITGSLTVNSKKLNGLVAVPATPFSAVSSVDIALANSPAGVTAFEVMIWGLTHSAAVALTGRFSFDGGSVYVASGYDGLPTNFAGATATVGADGAATSFPIANGLAGDTNKPTTIRLLIFTVNSGNNWTTTQSFSTGYIPGSGEHGITIACGFSPTAAGRATHLRLLPGSGTISGTYRVTPLFGTGDA